MNRALSVCCTGVLIVSLASACAEIFGPRYDSILGQIDLTFQPIAIPDTVSAKTDFTVSFYTDGGGCTKVGNTTVSMLDGHTAEVRPYDERQVNPSACTTELRFLPHSATLQFGQPGTGTVRLISAHNDSTITIARTVVVR